jgi:hypothetical protein
MGKSDQEKLDLFAEYLQEVFTPHNNLPLREVNSLLNEATQKPQRLQFSR